MRRLAAVLGTACTQLLVIQAYAQSASPVITPPQQATRDTERLLILQAELRREQDAVAEASRRLAVHLDAGDPRAASAADLDRARSTENVAALKREIAVVDRNAGRPVDRLAARTPTPSNAPATPPALSEDNAWWDVYATRPHVARTPSGPAQPRRP